MKFEALGIDPKILKALKDVGYETPTPIQEKAIPDTLKGRDVLGLAQTGTGKTAAFAIPTLQTLMEGAVTGKNRKIRALVLTPTRELGMQVYENFESYSKYLPLKSTVIFGGVKQGAQVKALRSGIDVLVATPGRLMDLIEQGYINLSHVEIFILDEADRMLDMGFIHDIKKILKLLPKKKQTLLFSATMPKEVTEIVDCLLVNPIQVSVAPTSSTVDTVDQYLQFVDKKHKVDLLEAYAKKHQLPMLVFTRTKRGADRLVKDLKKRSITAQAIHGDKSQNARQQALENFKNYKTHILVATDIAARGIDINELNYVVNYDLPEVPETYVHRIGRTGRAGHSGEAIAYVSHSEKPLLRDIERLIKKKITVLDNEEFPLMDKTHRTNSRPQPSNAKTKKKTSAKSKPKTKANTSNQKPKETGKGNKTKSQVSRKPKRRNNAQSSSVGKDK